MNRSKSAAPWFLALVAVELLVFSIGIAEAAQKTQIQWDIPTIDFSTTPITLSPGGQSSAIANDETIITLTGAGTFRTNSRNPRKVTGGGTWKTFAADGVTVTGTGTYSVTRFVSFVLAPMPSPPNPVTDNVCTNCTLHSGLAVLAIAFSDGSQGVLVISCNVPGGGTSEAVFEGITVSKDSVDYWNRTNPVPGVDGNRTLIHILQ